MFVLLAKLLLASLLWLPTSLSKFFALSFSIGFFRAKSARTGLSGPVQLGLMVPKSRLTGTGGARVDACR